jgi:hypothetical protein
MELLARKCPAASMRISGGPEPARSYPMDVPSVEVTMR